VYQIWTHNSTGVRTLTILADQAAAIQSVSDYQPPTTSVITEGRSVQFDNGDVEQLWFTNHELLDSVSSFMIAFSSRQRCAITAYLPRALCKRSSVSSEHKWVRLNSDYGLYHGHYHYLNGAQWTWTALPIRLTINLRGNCRCAPLHLSSKWVTHRRAFCHWSAASMMLQNVYIITLAFSMAPEILQANPLDLNPDCLLARHLE